LVELSTPVFEQVEKFRVSQIHGRPLTVKNLCGPRPTRFRRLWLQQLLPATCQISGEFIFTRTVRGFTVGLRQSSLPITAKCWSI